MRLDLPEPARAVTAQNVSVFTAAPRPRLTDIKERIRLLFINAQEVDSITVLGLTPYHHWISSVTQLPHEQIEVVHVADGARLPTTTEASGIIGGGSIHAAFEDHSWIRHTREFLIAAAQRGIPELHFCWSHQLKALAEGGDVARGPDGRRFGVERLQLTPAGLRDPLFAGLPAEFDVYTSHTDVITALPATRSEQPVELARGSVYRYEALAYGPATRTLQVHPELTAETMVSLAQARRAQLIREKIIGPSAEDFESFIRELQAQNEKVRQNSLKLVENWIVHILGPTQLRRGHESYLPWFTGSPPTGRAGTSLPARSACGTATGGDR
jgi:GMP synthase (glutamine-hydrolysing)